MSEFDDPALVGLGLALASGLLIGLERGWQQRERPEGHRVAGVRTFALIGLLGGLGGLLAQRIYSIFLKQKDIADFQKL